MIRRRLIITGRVQGVFYRNWFVAEMRALGILGWVRNRADNSVEAVIAGSADSIAAAIARAHQGPPAAHVVDVAVSDDAPEETLERFAKRPTV
ncbi:MAG: acylphosphatase [Candidatus Sphingomonas colombiensis]|nr:acylphosphatase [Sphingomonas sp.]WEK44620.1 MAG: acylphosphatase [Sphingomonas sp.]